MGFGLLLFCVLKGRDSIASYGTMEAAMKSQQKKQRRNGSDGDIEGMVTEHN